MNLETIAVKVTPAMAAGLADRAKALGNVTREGYATLLLEAAYAARVGQEKAAPATDGELDAMVRLALACAGTADTAAIARYLGLTEATVARILDGWRAGPTQWRGPANGAKPAASEPPPKRTFAAPAPTTERADKAARGLSDNALLLFAALAERCRDGAAEISPAELVDAGGAAGSLTFLRRRLEQRGLIQWTPGARNGKWPHCRLTVKGEKLAAELAREEAA